FKTEELGRTPKCREVARYWTIIRRFGSWNGALDCAGVQVCSINQRKVRQ
ncbi:homing endonuclease associated repeat-containing protein, partial [Eubacterium callanderi]